MKKEKKVKKKKKIRFKGLIIVILFIYLIGAFIYHICISSIKEINIEGNYYLKDNYIINYLDIDGESIISVKKSEVINKLLELDLVSSVKVSKNYLGILNISLVEEKVLFYNYSTDSIVLSNGEEIEKLTEYLGIPTLINTVPDTIYEEFIQKLSEIDRDIISLISEIEYSPSIVDNKTVDAKRFIFRMNDGNTVYVNTTNLEKFNNYLSYYEAIVNKNGDIVGCLYLDSNSENTHFSTSCNSEDKEVIDEE